MFRDVLYPLNTDANVVDTEVCVFRLISLLVALSLSTSHRSSPPNQPSLEHNISIAFMSSLLCGFIRPLTTISIQMSDSECDRTLYELGYNYMKLDTIFSQVGNCRVTFNYPYCYLELPDIVLPLSKRPSINRCTNSEEEVVKEV